MTNGEKIQTILDVDRDCTEVHGENGTMTFSVPQDWWNAEYKEPTTKNDLAQNLCDSCTNIGCEFQSGIVRTECAFYMPPHLEPDNCGNYVVQDSTTKNDLGVDAVSRKDVHDMLENLPITVENKWFNWLQKACMRLADLPPVTPQEPKTGHWISHREHCEMNNLLPSGLGSYFWCSECDCGIDSKDFARVNYNYCPNCGADMREVEK